jgi:hypothetical protein
MERTDEFLKILQVYDPTLLNTNKEQWNDNDNDNAPNKIVISEFLNIAIRISTGVDNNEKLTQRMKKL